MVCNFQRCHSLHSYAGSPHRVAAACRDQMMHDHANDQPLRISINQMLHPCSRLFGCAMACWPWLEWRLLSALSLFTFLAGMVLQGHRGGTQGSRSPASWSQHWQGGCPVGPGAAASLTSSSRQTLNDGQDGGCKAVLTL